MLERLLSDIAYRFRAVFRRHAVERELAAELALHIELETEKLMRHGMPPVEAARAARLSFGGIDRIKDATRDVRGVSWLDVMRQDGRQAFHQLRTQRAFAAAVVITLALGIGANAALFAIIDALFLRLPASVAAPEELFRLYRHQPPGERSNGFVTAGFPYPAVDNMAAVIGAQRVVTYGLGRRRLGRSEDAPQTVTVTFGPRYFALLGVKPFMGRLPTADEERIDGGAAVALISYAEWLRRYGGRPDVLGRKVELSYLPYTIIGVLPRGFTGIDASAADYWIPLGATRSGNPEPYHSSWSYGGENVIVRAPPAARVALVSAASAVMTRGAPDWQSRATVSAAPLKEARGPQPQPAELGVTTRLAAVAAILLLIACANVANLNLARAARRRQEIAVRLALGISRARLVLLLTMETVLLALLSCVAALLLAGWGGAALRRTLFPDISWHGSPVDVRVALFTLLVALLTGLVAGLPSALRASRIGLAPALKTGPREGTNARGSRVRATLVALQAGLCMVLLVAAGAFIKSLHTVTSIDVGFDVDRLAVVTAAFPDSEEHDPQLRAMMPRVIERLRALAQVDAVAESNWRPLSEYATPVAMFDEQGNQFAFSVLPPSYQVVSPDFFSVMGMRLVAGRIFTEQERDPGAPTIVINRAMAAALWPGRNPLGQCVRASEASAPCARVIGVVETAHRDQLIEPEPVAHYYRSLRQLQKPVPRFALVRAQPQHLGQVMAVAREEVRQDLSGGAYPDVRPLVDEFTRELRPWRLGAVLFSGFGVLALIVAIVGMYGVVAYIVQQRTHEIGVRMALGADTYDVAGMVVTDAGRMVGAGLIIGLFAAFLFGRVLESLLFETSPHDPAIIALVALMLFVCGAAAALAPAWRAVRVDPTEALRCE